MCGTAVRMASASAQSDSHVYFAFHFFTTDFPVDDKAELFLLTLKRVLPFPCSPPYIVATAWAVDELASRKNSLSTSGRTSKRARKEGLLNCHMSVFETSTPRSS